MAGRAENPFSALVELLRKQAEAAAPPAWVWGEVITADPLSVMVGGVQLRLDQIAGVESLQGAPAGKRVPLIADATGQHYAVLGEQRAEFPPEEHDHVVADLTDLFVGGTNLLAGTGLQGYRSIMADTNASAQSILGTVVLQPNTTYTISGQYRMFGGVANTALKILVYDETETEVFTWEHDDFLLNTFLYVQHTFTTGSVSYENHTVRFDNLGDPTGPTLIFYKLVKLEKGNVATDWSPAPSDKANTSHPHGNITNDGKVGTVADKTLMTGTDGLVVAKTMAEAIQIWKFTNPNLLHNWDFRNPVNQRGISGAYIEPLYTIDRWVKTNYATITFNANSLDFIQYGILEQRFEGHGLAGKVVTFSLDVGGTITAVTTSFPTSTGEINAYIGSNWEIKTMYTAGYMAVWFASLVAVSDIRRVKLELGTVSTLAYDPPMDHAVELPKCQRFYQLRSVNNVAAEDMRPLMRITNPTITGTGPYAYSADL